MSTEENKFATRQNGYCQTLRATDENIYKRS